MKILKICLFIILCCTLSFGLKAQNNLTFSRAVALTYTTTTNTSPTYTVPANKVWKIESAGASGGVLYIASINSVPLSIVVQGLFNNTSTPNLPTWLPAGTTITFGNYNTSSYNGFASILEFNAP